MTVDDYCVIREFPTNLGAFTALVKDAINCGWEPIGGVCYSHDYLYQAMIKKSPSGTINAHVDLKSDLVFRTDADGNVLPVRFIK